MTNVKNMGSLSQLSWRLAVFDLKDLTHVNFDLSDLMHSDTH